MQNHDLTLPLDELRAAFGNHLQTQVNVARYTAARVGGAAEVVLVASSAAELAEFTGRLWQMGVDFLVIGGGSNVLVSDQGVRGVVILNRARQVRFKLDDSPPAVWTESGANLGSVARQAAVRGRPGLEWAAGIPGTVGGAVVGNAGAHGADTASNLILAEILHLDKSINLAERQNHLPSPENWPVERFQYAYRTSYLKSHPGEHVVLSCVLRLGPEAEGGAEEVNLKVDEFTRDRRRTQPPGASMGSMFKNPPGDFAGRLIEAAGLKGLRQGEAQISDIHGNFFINTGQASANDIYQLIRHARTVVAEKFGIKLELEVELVGEW